MSSFYFICYHAYLRAGDSCYDSFYFARTWTALTSYQQQQAAGVSRDSSLPMLRKDRNARDLADRLSDMHNDNTTELKYLPQGVLREKKLISETPNQSKTTRECNLDRCIVRQDDKTT